MASDDHKLKHLEMIQGVINRLSTNSFLLKGWSIVLVSALMALSSADHRDVFVLLAFFPAFMFWGLDAYFLALERGYRKHYDEVRKQDTPVDFSMDMSKHRDLTKWEHAFFSKTLLAFHGVLIVTIIVVMVLGLTGRK